MRERRRCPACGVSIPADAGRCPTCGHHIGSPLVVAADRRSPAGRRTALLIGLALALLVGVLAVVDAGTGERAEEAAGEGTTTTRRERRTSTTRSSTATSEVRPFTSPISLPAGARFLAWTPNGEMEVLDPAAGTARTLSPDGLRRSDFLQVVPRLAGAVVVTGNSGQAYWLADVEGTTAPVELTGNIGAVFPSEIPGRVWLNSFGPEGLVQEFDLATGQPTASISLPFDAYVQGVVDGGLVVGTQDGIYLRRRDEDRFQRIVHGMFVASAGNRLAYRACDDRLVCGLFVHDLARDRSTPIGVTFDAWPNWGAFSPDGRWLAVSYFPPPGTAAELLVIDLVSGSARPVSRLPSQPREAPTGTLAWTPDSQWLLWPEGQGITAMNPADGTTVTIDIDAVYGGIAVVGPPA